MKDKIRSKFEEVAVAVSKTDVKEHEKLYYLSEILDKLSGVYVRMINLGNYEEIRKAQEQMDLNAYDQPPMSGDVN